MKEQITEQTNNEVAPGTEATPAAEVSVTAENLSADTAEGGENGGADNGTPSPAKEGENGVEGTAPRQENSKNKEMARQRRERERQAELKKARIEGIKSVLKNNPYTDKPIEDDSDVEEYLLMKQIEEDGKDPITDYPEYVKKQAREAARGAAQAQETNDKVTKDLEEFTSKHPTVDLNDLLQDENFVSFADGKLGVKSLAEVYASYLPIKDAIDAAKRDEQKTMHAKAVSAAAVGSLTNASEPADKDFFTFEQVKKMSKKEISENYDKIRKSQARW